MNHEGILEIAKYFWASEITFLVRKENRANESDRTSERDIDEDFDNPFHSFPSALE